MKFWNGLLVMLVVLTLGICALSTTIAAAEPNWWESGGSSLMGDPDGGGGYGGGPTEPSPCFRLQRDPRHWRTTTIPQWLKLISGPFLPQFLNPRI